VLVEGTHVGRLDGFRFVPDSAADGDAMKTLITAANRVLRSEVAARARLLAEAPDEAITIDAGGALVWRGGPVGRLMAGETLLAPRIDVRAGDFLDGELRERVRRRLQAFVKGEIERRLQPLFAAQALPLDGAARGLVYQLADRLGCLAAADVAAPPKALDRDTRRALGRLGIRFGRETIYIEPLLGNDAVRFRALLWAVRHGRAMPPLPGARNRGRALAVDPELPPSFYDAIGRRVISGLALRPDRLERLLAAARERARQGRFAGNAELAAIGGLKQPELRGVLLALGYRAVIGEDEELFIAPPRPAAAPPPPRPGKPREGHPFAKLKELKFA
jgi:ATP-dependent RNA helicase SUPV3L1/SUV3